MANQGMIEEAILNRRQIQLEYDGINRIVEPAHLFNYQNHCYFIGYCYDRNGWHTFEVDQIQYASVLPNPSMKAPITWRQVDLDGMEKRQANLALSHIGKIEIQKWNERKPDWSPGMSSFSSETQDKPLAPFTLNLQKSALPIFPKEIQFEKMKTTALCQSPLEEKIYRFISQNDDVKEFIAKPFAIPFLLDAAVHYYTPDALVFYREGKPSLVEVRLAEEIHTTVNQEKFKAAFVFAEEEGWEFCVIRMESLASNLDSQNRRRFRWGEGLQKPKLEPFDPFSSNQEVTTATDASVQRRSMRRGIKRLGWFCVVAGLLLVLGVLKLHFLG